MVDKTIYLVLKDPTMHVIEKIIVRVLKVHNACGREGHHCLYTKSA